LFAPDFARIVRAMSAAIFAPRLLAAAPLPGLLLALLRLARS
jgi:hypothetical protein